jgi:hypothetical protein
MARKYKVEGEPYYNRPIRTYLTDALADWVEEQAHREELSVAHWLRRAISRLHDAMNDGR